MHSGEVEYFDFWVFDLKPEFGEKVKSNVVTIKKMSIRSFKRLALSNEQTIINKGK